MANLNFKMGAFANLPSTIDATTAGTVYVTTDEKAIYVDVPTLDAANKITGANRIRLGQIIIWDESQWATAQPPFSTEAFYYVTGANALLRYNGTNWTQINSTSDLEVNIGHIETLLSYKGVLTKAPTNPAAGDIYYNSASEKYQRYNGNKWVNYSGLGVEINRIDSVATEVATAQSRADDAYSLASQKTTIGEVEAKGYAKITELNAAKTAILGTTTENGTTKDFNGTVKGAYGKADSNATAIAELQKKLKVADALVYMGTINSQSNLPIISTDSKIEKGHTYKAIAKFTLSASNSSTGNAINIYIGDLLIANGTENTSTGFIDSNLKWDHIPSGYVAEYVPKMSIANISANTTTLQLTSAHADSDETGDLGEIQVQGSTNINLTPVVSNNKAVGVQFGLVWGTF